MTKPNIILILADDMGFSDIGCFGSEIRTPNIDRMAANGAALSAMYNCARCCPTRASLLTGLYPHKAGIGHMGADLGAPAYQGYLRRDAATIAECLRPAGYRTMISGKWHVGGDLDPRNMGDWPLGDATHPMPRQRGFDEFYGLMDGASSFFSPHAVLRDDGRVEITEDNFHFTDAITDAACNMIRRADDPFFLYLAYTAPHWPLHARAEDIAGYAGAYDKGWDAVRTARHEELNGKHLLRKPWDISPRDADAPPFDHVEHKDWEAARMATYAAMITQMDRGIGKVMETLKAKGELDNTLILFLSDNGGCAEFMAEDGWARFYPRQNHDGTIMQMGNRPDLSPGGRETFMSYDLPWANVSNAPFRSFKHWVHEGGVSTPLIAHWPDRIKDPLKAHEPCHVVDILPTILAAAGAPHPAEVNGHAAQSLDGEDLTQLLAGQDWTREQPIYWEHEGNAAIRAGEWKLVRRHEGPWELYQMDEDRTELTDLAGGEQTRVAALSSDYHAWADSIGVLDWATLTVELRRQWGIEGDR